MVMAYEIQPLPSPEDSTHSPQVIATKTNLLLGLYYRGALIDPSYAQDYLKEYTLPFLKRARQGSDRVGKIFNVDRRIAIDMQPVDKNEAADATLCYLTWLHKLTETEYLEMGFSKDGMLRAPRNKQEFEEQVDEFTRIINRVVNNPRNPPRMSFAEWKTSAFFWVGSYFPYDHTLVNSREEEEVLRETWGREEERRKFNDLLKDIKF